MSRTRPFSYITFVLRLWPANGPDGRWRAHLENPRTGERHGFTNPQELVAFLGQAGDERVQDVPDDAGLFGNTERHKDRTEFHREKKEKKGNV